MVQGELLKLWSRSEQQSFYWEMTNLWAGYREGSVTIWETTVKMEIYFLQWQYSEKVHCQLNKLPTTLTGSKF